MITVVNNGIYNMVEEDFGINHKISDTSFHISVPTGRGSVMRTISIPTTKLTRFIETLKDLEKEIANDNTSK